MNSEERSYLNQLKQTHTRRLRQLRLKEAQLGGSCPPEIIIEISDIEVKLKRLEQQFAKGTRPTKTNSHSKNVAPEPVDADDDDDTNRLVSVEMPVKYWLSVIKGIELMCENSVQIIKEMRESKLDPKALDSHTVIAIAGPLFARGILVKVMVEKGILKKEAAEAIGIDRLLEVARDFEAQQRKNTE